MEQISMKTIIVIGTRPQYIKIKPLYDYLKKNNIDSYLIDTNQHYSDNVSKNIIEGLGLEVDCNLQIKSNDEMSFLSNAITSISNAFKDVCGEGDVVVVIGDTNSTLASSIVAKKMGLKLAHIEAGIRCGDRGRPEEINRILVDDLSDVHFISRKRDVSNVSNPIYVGDLEYSFLNSIEHRYDEITYGEDILLTIHRQENMNVSALYDIFGYCHTIEYPILFPIHHRIRNFINDNGISIPNNIKVVEPFEYFDMIEVMRGCKGIISDSGGISKTSPFFGKKCVIPLEKIEWSEIIDAGYATNELNLGWFDDYKIERDTNFYYTDNSCKIILEGLNEK